MTAWPAQNYEDWSASCDTLHALTQILGKLCVALAYPQPELMHAALRLTARGWETAPLPAPDGSGAFVVALDLRAHEAVVEHVARDRQAIALPGRSVADVYGELLAAVQRVAGPVTVNPTAQEVSWDVPLDRDTEHRDYDPVSVGHYLDASNRAALVLAELRAPFRGRASDVNAWWGSFDLAVNLYSGRPAAPPSDDFIMRNAMDAEEVAVGWWPGDANHPGAAFYAYAHPGSDAYKRGDASPGHWDETLSEFVLEWSDVIAADDPHACALQFARAAVVHSCEACGWPAQLAASVHGQPPPVS